MSTLFITGSSGFVGSHLLRGIGDTKYDTVYCLVRSPQAKRARMGAANCQFISGSLVDSDAYASCLRSVTTVIHLAAVTGKARRHEYYAANTHGTEVLLRECCKAGVKNFLHISTIAAKFAEKQGYYYAESKERTEIIVQSSGLNYTIIRPTIILGEDAPIWKSLSKLARFPILPIFGNGRTAIQPIYIGDLVDCLLYILDNNVFTNEIIELGGPEEITIENFLKKIHSFYFQKEPHVVHIPVRFVIRVLTKLEKVFYRIMPITAGQLASFVNDGTVQPNNVFVRNESKMRNIDDMLRMLINGN